MLSDEEDRTIFNWLAEKDIRDSTFVVIKNISTELPHNVITLQLASSSSSESGYKNVVKTKKRKVLFKDSHNLIAAGYIEGSTFYDCTDDEKVYLVEINYN